MKKLNFMIIFLLLVTVNLAFADWDATCLDTCFSTGHDCNYCNYQCTVYDNYRLIPNYSGDTVCPFSGYQNYDDGYED